jgi:hypothetical protein
MTLLNSVRRVPDNVELVLPMFCGYQVQYEELVVELRISTASACF